MNLHSQKLSSGASSWSAPPLRILLLEDNSNDAFVTERSLQKSGISAQTKRVENELGFVTALMDFRPHLIISDFYLPKFDAFAALEIVKEVCPEIPFIVVSGRIEEKTAIECLARGANDYVMKDRLDRLPYAVRNAVNLSAERRRRLATEEANTQAYDLLSSLSDSVSEVLYVTNIKHTRYFYVSPAFKKLFGDEPTAFSTSPRACLNMVHESDRNLIRNALANAQRGYKVVFRVILPDGTMRWLSATGVPTETQAGKKVCGIIRDITEQRTAQEIEHREEMLEQREEFIATLTHDLKNPIIGAQRVLTLLRGGFIGAVSGEQIQILDSLIRSNEHMLEMIQTVLQVSRYDMGIGPQQLEQVDMRELVTDCANNMTVLADAKRMKIVLDFKAKEAQFKVEGERLALYRVLQNLFDNAIKFGAEESGVRVELNCDNETLSVSTLNQGVVLTPEERKHLFQKFRRAGTGRNSSHSSGLGLYLCKQIVEAHGGEIHCESSEETGTLFSFQVPCTQAQDQSRCV